MNDRLKTGLLTKDDFKEMAELEALFYDENFITPYEEAYEWYRYRPYSINVIRNNGNIVAFMNLFPISHHLYNNLYHGTFNDADLTWKHIEVPKKGGTYHLFLSCILVHPNCQGMGLARQLLQEYCTYYNQLDATFQNVIIDTVTKDGRKFATSYGFHFIGETNHNSTIFITSFEELLKK